MSSLSLNVSSLSLNVSSIVPIAMRSMFSNFESFLAPFLILSPCADDERFNVAIGTIEDMLRLSEDMLRLSEDMLRLSEFD